MELIKRLQAHAQTRLPPETYGYFAGGAGCESLLLANERAWSEVPIQQALCSGESVAQQVHPTLRFQAPLLLAPVAAQQLLHPGGECAVARAAAKRNVTVCLSTRSTTDVAVVAEAAQGKLWFQLYVDTDRNHVRRVLKRLRPSGVQAVVLTLDMPTVGRREREEYFGSLHLPKGVLIADHLGSYMPTAIKETGGWEVSVNWEDISWVKEQAELPVLVKGVLRGEDAEQAIAYGADGVIVSNHGARQLDGVLPTAVVLAQVVRCVASRVPVLVDGGIRSGEDLWRAQSLGAYAALIGRPYIWGLAAGGEEGVGEILDSYLQDFSRTVTLAGTPN